MMSIGMNIKKLRERAGMQQAELAEKVGVSQSMICQIERGTKACSIPLGADIARELNCEIGDLMNAERRLSETTQRPA